MTQNNRQSDSNELTYLKEFQQTTQVLMGEMRLLGEVYAKQMQVMMAQLQSQGQLTEQSQAQLQNMMDQTKQLLEQNEARNQEYSTSIQAATQLMTTIVDTTSRLETISATQVNLIAAYQDSLQE